MNKLFLRICSLLIAIVMIINVMPINVIATEVQGNMSVSTEEVDSVSVEDTYIIDEIISRRTEYTKEFKLSNGLNMTTVYADAVHYDNDGTWADIDNTLCLSNGVYTNTAGVWDVNLPQQMGSSTPVSISKDGYVLSFYLAGELHSNLSDVEVASTNILDNYSVQNLQFAAAQVLEADSLIQNDQYPEITSNKLYSTLQYSNAFSGTDVRYDLHSNQLKESIIMDSFDDSLRGYKYILDVGSMNPVLTDSMDILLYDVNSENVIMSMPAPYLLDNSGEISSDITVSLTGNGNKYTLTYILPQDWLSDDNRQWPVILDPIITADTTRSNIRDAYVNESNPNSNYQQNGALNVGYRPSDGVSRSYLKYENLPDIGAADVIVYASLYLGTLQNYNTSRIIEAHKVLSEWASETITWANMPEYDDTIEDYVKVTSSDAYAWELTDVVREWYEDENTGVMLKALDSVEKLENDKNLCTQFASSDFGPNARPQLLIFFRNNNGLESYWDYTASSAGRSGTGYVNNYTGNLVWIRSDIGFSGNRMPVSITHVYNANDCDENEFGLGYGWRSNFNQLVYEWDNNSNSEAYYIWEDSDGTMHYFKANDDGIFEDEDGLELTLSVNEEADEVTITDKNGNKFIFDSSGRLKEQQNNQKETSSIRISYDGSSKRISSVIDGANREYHFNYVDDLLEKIEYVGFVNSGEAIDSISSVQFDYDAAADLISITDNDNNQTNYAYTENHLLEAVTDIDGYKLAYEYVVTAIGQPNRISKVCEYDGETAGGELTIQYDHNQTVFTDVSGNVQILQFNNWGNTVSIQDGEGRAQYAEYANNGAVNEDSSAKGNQLSVSSKLQTTVGNMLNNSSFEENHTWTSTSTAISHSVRNNPYHGANSLKISASTEVNGEGVVGPAITVESGETYTFSAYVKTDSCEASLSLSDGTVTQASQAVTSNDNWTRIEVAFTATSDTSITPKLSINGSGSVYMDCIQLERAPTASRYNLVDNGDFTYGIDGWTRSSKCTSSENVFALIGSSGAPQLDSKVFRMEGDPTSELRVSREIPISGNAGDSFVLAGWAKGDAVPAGTEDDERTFAIVGTFINSDGSETPFTFDFNPDADEMWQYRAGVMVAQEDYQAIKVEFAYSYNCNTVYFDGMQLYKEPFGHSYVYDDEGNVVSVVDLQQQLTEYEYENNDLKGVTLPTGAKLEYDYDDYHNVTSAITAEGVKYEFTYDDWGNNLSVSAVSEKEGVTQKITSTANYSDDGNRLEFTVDPLGNKTQYGYNVDTNMLEWIQYPEDTSATRTTYTYDEMYRVATTAATTDTGHSLSTVYTYEDDLLKKLETPSTTYDFAYGNFALRSNIKIGERTLAQYSYEDRTNRMTELDYGNGDEVKYTYDQQGRIIRETYEDDSYVSYEYDNSGALATVFDSGSGITSTYYYDFTDRLMRYVEQGDGFSHILEYAYDDINNLDAIVDTINGVEYTTTYDYDDDNRVKSVTNGSTSEHYEYDEFGRLAERITKNGETELFTEVYSYREVNGRPTEQVENLTITSAVSDYSISYDYTYDSNGNIASICDGVHTIRYTYDSANQLIREDNHATGVTRVWTYDDAGNILTCCQYAYTTAENPGEVMMTDSYTYGDSDWGDLLTAYNGQNMSYDQIGNLLNDGTWTYTWEHGRQLESMSAVDLDNYTTDITIDFTYNSDGIRTGKTVTTTNYHIHEYTEFVVAPTCTDVGYTLHTCECGYSYQSDQVDVTEHSYVDSVVAPTCTQSGYTLHECVCGDSYKTDYTDPLGHNYKLYRCTRCGQKADEIVNPVEPPDEGELMSLGEEPPFSTTSGISIPIPVTPIERVLISTVVTEYEYVYTGGKLMQMVITTTTTTAEGGTTVAAETLSFYYDADGRPLTMTYGNSTYYYVTNVQGDVVAILDSSGQSVVTYSYSAWGACRSIRGELASDLGETNPLRYRGYVYDSETKLYYLQSRYYSPLRCRFINADTFASTGQGFLGHNAYAYCNNNPVINSDPEGQSAVLTYLAFGVVGGIVNCGTSFFGAIITGQGFSVADGCAAFASGFLCATNLRTLGSLVSGFYTAYTCNKNGASSGAAILAGIFAGLMTYFAPGNLINLEKELANLGLQAFVDTIFGIGYNSSTAAVANMATPDNPGKNNTSTDNATSTTQTSTPQNRSTGGSSRGGGHPSVTTACVCLY